MSLKTLAEKLNEEETGELPADVRQAIRVLQGLIQRHRPTGRDGTHGALHTKTCGCDNDSDSDRDE